MCVLREVEGGCVYVEGVRRELLRVVSSMYFTFQLKDVHGQLKSSCAGGGLPCIHPGG